MPSRRIRVIAGIRWICQQAGEWVSEDGRFLAKHLTGTREWALRILEPNGQWHDVIVELVQFGGGLKRIIEFGMPFAEKDFAKMLKQKTANPDCH